METVRVPKRFFDDHESRDLDTPRVVKVTKQHYHIAADDPAIPELLNDAEYYLDPNGAFLDVGLRASAQATVKALRAIPNIEAMIGAYDHDGTRR